MFGLLLQAFGRTLSHWLAQGLRLGGGTAHCADVRFEGQLTDFLIFLRFLFLQLLANFYSTQFPADYAADIHRQQRQ